MGRGKFKISYLDFTDLTCRPTHYDVSASLLSNIVVGKAKPSGERERERGRERPKSPRRTLEPASFWTGGGSLPS